MPVTPFHFGPGLLFKAAAPRWFSFTAFVASQCVIDLETAYNIVWSRWPLHRDLHTVRDGTVIGVIAGVAALPLAALAARIVRREGLARTPGELSFGPALIGGAIGGSSHAVLDAIMHSDVQPLAPWVAGNPAAGVIPALVLHLLCVIAGVAGIALLARRTQLAGTIEAAPAAGGRRLERIAIGVVFGLSLIVGGAGLVGTNPLLLPPERKIAPVADSRLLTRHVRALASTAAPRNHAQVAALAEAAGYIRDTWRAQGHRVEEQPFSVGPDTHRNLWISSGPAGGERVIIGAHYDVCGDQPGADDNASGVAAILELGRLLAARPASRRVDLVAWTLEEPPYFRTPLMGSVIHAGALASSGATVRGVIALDMVGYFRNDRGSQQFPHPVIGLVYPDRGDFLAVVGPLSELALTRRVKSLLSASTAIDIRSMNAPASIPGIDYSDHRSYWRHGFRAVLVTDTSFYRHPHYHEPGDVPELLDYGRLAHVVGGLYTVATEL